MKAWLIIGALIWAICAPAALWVLYDHEHKAKLQTELALKDAKAAVVTETKIQTLTKTVYVKAQKEIDNVQHIDAKCENGDDLVSGFRAGIERLRDTSGSGAVSSGAVPGSVDRASQDGQ